MNSSPKPRKCKTCGTSYTPARPMQTVCSPLCAMVLARKVSEVKIKAKKTTEQREIKAKLQQLKSISELEKDAEREVNRYVRMRDAHEGCISCDKPASWGGQWHASHFRSVGAASSVRFNLWNIHKACSVCNNYLSGNIGEYLPRIIQKIGAEKVEWLKQQNKPVKRDRDYLIRLKDVFRKKANRQQKRVK